jgi:hypothetical protein
VGRISEIFTHGLIWWVGLIERVRLSQSTLFFPPKSSCGINETIKICVKKENQIYIRNLLEYFNEFKFNLFISL